ncbi:Glutamate synthase [NADPH] small chain [subsurface metagenome]
MIKSSLNAAPHTPRGGQKLFKLTPKDKGYLSNRLCLGLRKKVMGKHNGFLDIPRKVADKQSVGRRLKHFMEIYRSLSEEELIEQAARCMNCGTPFCHGYGCPLENSVPEWNELVFKDRWKEASDLLHLTNNFPEVTGRVCPALCEASCVASIGGDAVTIRQLELAIVEKAWEEGWVQPTIPENETEKRIAVIGSGPVGLAAAQQLRRAGHRVSVYEKSKRPGGLLRYGIPEFKLEKWVIDRRVRQMEAEGVDFQCNIDAGEDISKGYLLKKYDAICLTTGSGVPRDIDIPGRSAKGIHFAMDYLAQHSSHIPGEKIPENVLIDAKGKHVIVIGGGDTSNDCMGTALRQEAAHVEQLEILPEPPQDRDDDSTPWPMWPYMLRTGTSHEEGGQRQFGVNALEFLTNDKNEVTGIRCERVEWTRDGETGRVNFAPVAGSEFTVKADLVLFAMGFVHPKHEGLLDSLGVDYDARGNVKIDDTGMTSVEKVFAAGDTVSGAWLVVGAIAAGRNMARNVDMYLMGASDLPKTEPVEMLTV